MAQRLVDIYLPEDCEDLPGLEEENVTVDTWTFVLEDDRHLIRVLVVTEQTEAFLAWLTKELKHTQGYRIVVSDIEASVPLAPEQVQDGEVSEKKKQQAKRKRVRRISREELHQDLKDEISSTTIYLVLVVLSTVVAAAGMLRDSVAIVIGAMVIAPLIGPNIALAFATTIGDIAFLLRSLWLNILGLLLGLAVSVVVALMFVVDPTTPEIASRLIVNWSDIILALAAGAAGSISFTRGVSTALIGVMVAVALLPPLVAVGLMIGLGAWYAAYSASLLVLTNIVCINLSAVFTFLVQGIRPLGWHRAEVAPTHTRVAIFLWVSLLVLLIIAVYLVSEPAILE